MEKGDVAFVKSQTVLENTDGMCTCCPVPVAPVLGGRAGIHSASMEVLQCQPPGLSHSDRSIQGDQSHGVSSGSEFFPTSHLHSCSPASDFP